MAFDPKKIHTMDDFHKFINEFVLSSNQVMGHNIQLNAKMRALLIQCEQNLRHKREVDEIGRHHCSVCDLRKELRELLGLRGETDVPEEFR